MRERPGESHISQPRTLTLHSHQTNYLLQDFLLERERDQAREGKEILHISRSLFFSVLELAVSGDISEFSPKVIIPAGDHKKILNIIITAPTLQSE